MGDNINARNSGLRKRIINRSDRYSARLALQQAAEIPNDDDFHEDDNHLVDIQPRPPKP